MPSFVRRRYTPLFMLFYTAVPKLSAQDKFLDLSDYGRPLATLLVKILKNTWVTPIHVTLLFGVAGLLAIGCILQDHYWAAGLLIILKSILDAADGELARAKQTPSYTGRYLDSVFDIVLNFLFLMTICFVSETTFLYAFLAFISIQLQGTLYNYYYVILRNQCIGGDSTSHVFEDKSPGALSGESQRSVDALFTLYTVFYRVFDKTIQCLDQGAHKVVSNFPNWFMTLVSVYGLGFQLLIIAIMLPMGWIEYIAPFFIIYSVFIFVLIGIRKSFRTF